LQKYILTLIGRRNKVDNDIAQDSRINSEQVQQRQNLINSSVKSSNGAENSYTAMSRGSDILIPDGTLLDDILSFKFLGRNSRS
jgi:hypothetical protein